MEIRVPLRLSLEPSLSPFRQFVLSLTSVGNNLEYSEERNIFVAARPLRTPDDYAQYYVVD